MKVSIWILIVTAMGVWLVTSMIDSRRLRDEERAEAQTAANALSASIATLVNRHQADSDWVEKLSGGKFYRVKPILTIELEDLWVRNGPILFIGAIKDIASEGDNLYTVTIERSLVSGMDHMFDTELRLELTSDKGLVDRFLSNHPTLFEGYGFNNGVGVIARVRKIRAHEYANEEGMSVDTRIGLGDMIDLIYVGDGLF